jgi:hypothetical protein
MKAQPFHTVRNSKIHGRGVFAKRPIRKGSRVIEYTGPIITTKEADEVGAAMEGGLAHTMLFSIDKKRVIDGTKGGDARYINHSCDPNCEAIQDGDQIFIESLRPIKQGEEITYDYHLQVEGKITDKVKKEYACLCGSAKCRGTQIAPEILEKQAKKDAKKAAKKEKKRQAKEMKKAQKEQAKSKDKAKAEVKAKDKSKAKDKAKAKGDKKDKTKAKEKVKAKDKPKSVAEKPVKKDAAKALGKKSKKTKKK